LGPERTREYEVGFDASLYNGRITAEVTAFHQRTTDALIPVQPVPSLGFTSTQLRNVGMLENKGGEVSLGLGIIRRRNLTWTLGLMASLTKSKAIDLGGERVSLSDLVGVREGYPVPSFFANKVVNPNEYAAYIIETDQFIGPAVPDRMMSVSTNVTLGDNLVLSALGEYQGGAVMLNQTGKQMANRDVFGPCFEAQQALRAGDPQALSRITALVRSKCTVVPTQQLSENWIEATDFFKLRTITLTYQLPDGLLPRTQSAALTLAAGGNLWTKTDYWGTDPESRALGPSDPQPSDHHGAPPYRTYVASLRVRF
jgi:hypothetical protein